MRKFNNVIDRAKLLEVPLSNGRFTWSREGSTLARSLIDCFFIHTTWDQNFENTGVNRQERLFSDHFPLFLKVDLLNGGLPLLDFVTVGCATKNATKRPKE